MANYALKYYKEITQANGKIIRLELHEQGPNQPATEIGAVIQDLTLQIQGQQGDIDTPIIKTSLSMTFVDAYDLQDGKKNGFWEEFYTPNAVYWKVIVKAWNSAKQEFYPIWGGYVTPDSYSEPLTYRGSVNIIARDNIGHLQDFPFDFEGNTSGMVSLSSLINAAWEKIESPMFLLMPKTGVDWLQCEGVNALDTYMNVSAFEGKNWYEVLESVLYAYGLVMRYDGDNNVRVYPLRNMPYYGKDSVYVVQPKFQTGATRELVPAAKRIEEKSEYEVLDSLQQKMIDNSKDFSGEVEKVTVKNPDNISQSSTIEFWPITRKVYGSGWINGNNPAYFNPLGYTLNVNKSDERDLDFMWFACAYETSQISSPDDTPRYIEYSRYIELMPFKIEASFGRTYLLSNGTLTQSSNIPTRVKLNISILHNNTTYYLNEDGEWVTSSKDLNIELNEGAMSLDIPQGDLSGFVLLSVKIIHVLTITSLDSYHPIYSFSLSVNKPLLTTNAINTNYNDNNNVIISRGPVLGPAMDTVLLPGIIKNGIFNNKSGRYTPAKLWSWNGNGPQQMAVYNHLQLLCYFAKPNSVITGTIVNGDVTSFTKLYRWEGVPHLIISANLDLITGYIENAILREFAYYDDLWGDLTDTADFPEVEGSVTTNKSGGSGASDQATVSSTTNVNIVGGGGAITLDTDMSDTSSNGVQNKVIKRYVDNAISKVGEDINLIDEWRKNLTAKFYIGDDGKVYCKTDLIISGEVASIADGGSLPGGGGASLADVESYLYEIGNIDRSNIESQKVLSATKLVTKSNANVVVIDDNMVANVYGTLLGHSNARINGSLYVAGTYFMLDTGASGLYFLRDRLGWHESNVGVADLMLCSRDGISINTTLQPYTTNARSLGTSDRRWSNIYTASADISENTTIGGNLVISGDVASK